MASPGKRPSFQQVTLLGIVILAVIAVLIAWMDSSGMLEALYESLSRKPY